MPESAHSVKINHSSTPIRLFESDFLEFFTHISPITVLVIWLPVAGYSLTVGVLGLPAAASPAIAPAAFILGLFVWTLAEYTLHRFVFHYEPKTPAQERVFFLFHGVHHAQPQLKTRLVMPPVVSLPLAVIFYGLIYLVVGLLLGAPAWTPLIFCGFVVGYLLYDMTHYATHHFPMRSGYLKFLKRYHMRHHYRTPNARFGVSSPLWDYVFRTAPVTSR
ncbi:MAG: fatty acid hydroxylase [Chloroflexi bacterium]|nr:fatty acid hydroxylase [Chloroflexota bacterium]